MQIRTFLLPELVDRSWVKNRTAVVIDVLRASTTILTALESGCSAVVPCREVEQARSFAASVSGKTLLGGERGGVPIEGFDLGNSPGDYRPERVAEATLVFTTTNGTRAIDQCAGASDIWVASLRNCAAVVHELANHDSIAVVCAGTDKSVTSEDTLCAGAIVHRLRNAIDELDVDDAGFLAESFWENAASREDGVLTALRNSRGGQNLRALGLQSDIEFAAELDMSTRVPKFDAATGRIM